MQLNVNLKRTGVTPRVLVGDPGGDLLLLSAFLAGKFFDIEMCFLLKSLKPLGIFLPLFFLLLLQARQCRSSPFLLLPAVPAPPLQLLLETSLLPFSAGKVLILKCSASIKVLNSGLGPFKDQTAEMVLFWSFFLHKSPFFPIMIIMLCNPVPGTKGRKGKRS